MIQSSSTISVGKYIVILTVTLTITISKLLCEIHSYIYRSVKSKSKFRKAIVNVNVAQCRLKKKSSY